MYCHRNAKGGLVLIVSAALIAVATFASSTPSGQALLGRWSYIKSVERDTGTYYRLNVSLAYKGEPLNFDIVVGCNVKVTRYKDNDRTVEVGIAPMAYGLKTADGSGIVVRPPHACGGETTDNGKVPATLLPLVVTYQKADEPWFGRAYVSDDTYNSPRSELKFFGARISHATRQQWEEWRRLEASNNFLTYQLLGINPKNPWDQIRWKPGDRFVGSQCHALAKVKLAAAAREIVRAQWPVDRPSYWYPNEETLRALGNRPRGESIPPEWLFENYRMEQFYSPSVSSFRGLPRREPGAVIGAAESVAGAIYPARTDLTPNVLGADGRLSAEVAAKTYLSWIEADVQPELRGFAYCDGQENIAGLPSFIDVGLNLNRMVNHINGEVVRDHPPRQAGTGRTNFRFVFERDEYVYFYRHYGLTDIFGGL